MTAYSLETRGFLFPLGPARSSLPQARLTEVDGRAELGWGSGGGDDARTRIGRCALRMLIGASTRRLGPAFVHAITLPLPSEEGVGRAEEGATLRAEASPVESDRNVAGGGRLGPAIC